MSAPYWIIHSAELPWSYGWELIETAEANGYFSEFDVEIERMALSPDFYTEAMERGKTDFTPFADFTYQIYQAGRGTKTKQIVASSMLIQPGMQSDGLFVLRDSGIASAKDLVGKTIGMLSTSYSSYPVTVAFLENGEVDRKDVNFLSIPTRLQRQCLERGDVDALHAFGPIDAELRRDPGSFLQLFRLSDLGGRHMLRGGTVVLDDFLEKNGDLVRRYVHAIAKAADWANKHPADVIRLGIQKGKIDASLAPYIYGDGSGDYRGLRWAAHGLVERRDVKYWLDFAERTGIVEKGKLDPDDLFTNRFNIHS